MLLYVSALRRKNILIVSYWVMVGCHGYLEWSVLMIWMWSSCWNCHPVIYCLTKSHNGSPFWCRLTCVVLENRPLIACCRCCCWWWWWCASFKLHTVLMFLCLPPPADLSYVVCIQSYGSTNVLDCARQWRIKIIHVSSEYITCTFVSRR